MPQKRARSTGQTKPNKLWDTWFQDYRVPNETGEYATQEDWDNLKRALPELNKIYQQMQNKNSDLYNQYQAWVSEGYKQDNLKTPDPRVFIAKEYYKQKHPEYDYEHPWYSGQARWETKYQYPGQSEASNTDKVTRFPYFSKSGYTWWSNNPNYAKTFAEYYDSRASGSRYEPIHKHVWNPEQKTSKSYTEENPEAKVTGEVFQAYFPKNIESSLDLQGPAKGKYDNWTDMPFEVTPEGIHRLPDSELISWSRASDYKKYTDAEGNYVEVQGTKKPRESKLNTDKVVEAANKSGNSVVYFHNVGDGFMMKDADNYKHGDPIEKIYQPIDELITLPDKQQNQQGISIKGAGFSPTPGKRKDGTPYLYADIGKSTAPQYAKKGAKLIKKNNT